MKKFILLAGLVISVVTVSQSKTTVTGTANHYSIQVTDTTWKKGTVWTGMNQGKEINYKINPKTLVIYSSVNTKTWGANMGGIWTTKDGKSIRITDKKLMWSTDSGKTWTAVPDGVWQDADGDWCKFDADWNLWIKKAGK